MIWIADASDVGLLVTLLEPEKQRNPHQLSHCIDHESYLYSHLRKGGERLMKQTLLQIQEFLSELNEMTGMKISPMLLRGLTPPLFCLERCSL